jgi:predicted PurR-regulated permease PerM
MAERPAKPTAPRDPPDWRSLRLWHIQPVRDVLVLALVFGVLYAGYVLRCITVPMLLALLLAYLFEPLVKRLTRSRHISRPGAALGIIAAAFFVVVVPVVVGVGVGVTQAVRLVSSVADSTRSLVAAVQEPDNEKRLQRIEALPRGWEFLGNELNGFRDHIIRQQHARENAGAPPGPDEPPAEPLPEQPSPAPDRPGEELKRDVYTAAYAAIDWVRSNADNIARSIGQTALTTGQGAIATAFAFFGTLAVLAFGAFLTAFFFFFFSTGWGKVLDFWASLIPERKKGVAFDLIAKMDRVIAGFVRGRLTICAIMGVLHTIAYWLIGVPVPLVIGPIAGLLYIVPFLHILSIPVGIILLWLQPSSIEWQNNWWWIIFAPVVVDVAGQFLDDWVLSPTIQGKTTNMDTPTILFASMAGGALAGMYGLLVAIPVAACLRILIQELFLPRFRRWARGQERDFLPISSDDAPKPREPAR